MITRAALHIIEGAIRAAEATKLGPGPALLLESELNPAADCSGAPPAGLLVRGDNLEVLAALRPRLQGQVHLCTIDPPFASGVDRDYRPEGTPAAFHAQAYRDRWGAALPDFIEALARRLAAIFGLLHPEGSLLLHCDHRLSPYLALICDAIFGSGDRLPGPPSPGFRNEIIWRYGLGGSSPRFYPRKHDTILWYTKGPRWTFHAPRVPATSQRLRGRTKKCPDVWDLPSLNNMSKERTGYGTQKPLALLRRIIEAHTRPGDLVLDCYSGSGTALEAAASLDRRFVGIDQSPVAVHVADKRLRRALPTLSYQRWATPAAAEADDRAPGAVHLRAGPEGRFAELIWDPEDPVRPLDGWEVALAAPGAALRPIWWSYRARGASPVAQRSAPLPPRGALVARLVLISGTALRLPLSVRAEAPPGSR